MTKIVLGNKYKDTLHGIVGVAVCHSKYLTGCDQVQLEVFKKDEIIGYWFDITRLVGVKVDKADKKPGGPQAHAPARNSR